MNSVLHNAGGGGWFIEYGGNDDPQGADFLWASHAVDDPETADRAFDEASLSKKRSRGESSAGPGTKACREKLRRDRLNDRFAELGALLEPERPPRADKVAILLDATRRITNLRIEAQTLKESNDALQGTIKSIKSDKSDLRDEKISLKAEKERLQQVLKGISSAPTPTQFMRPNPAAVTGQYCTPPPLPTAPATTTFGEPKSAPSYRPVQMWQWIPPAALDTSQDHVLRPPVA